MRARVKWLEGVAFVGESESGHAVVMDGAPDAGGHNLGFRPMEMLLLGLGGCASFDVVLILQRGRHAVTDCVVELEAERAPEPPRVFTRIHARFIVTGKGIPESAVRRAVQLSAEKYCSATLMLGKTAAMSHDFEVVEAP